jgi:protein required for attachment to host cells
MIDSGTTWIVAADGARARVFEERRRSGELRELTDRAMRVEEGDHPRAAPQRATVHERTGSGRHAANPESPAQEAERRFLARVVEALDAAAYARAFDHLVLVAPPIALGILRRRLTPALSSKLDVSDAHDRTRADAREMRGHLRNLRTTH